MSGIDVQERLKLYSIGELFALPEPQWLIRDIMPTPGLCLLYGASGYGKSFVAIDLAMSVATGRDWMGQFPVEQGAVVYIAAEGLSGIKKRVAAWQTHHTDAAHPTALTFCLKAVDLYDEASREALLDALEEKYPSTPEHFMDIDTGDQEIVETNE